MIEKEITPGESLAIIRGMIEKTKQEISGNSIYFLVWGWGAFLACVGQFYLMSVLSYPYHYRVWYITIICIVITIGLGMRQKKNQRVKTYISESMSYLWTGMSMSFFVMSVIFIKIGWQYCFPFFILLYAVGTFISGKILKYQPFVLGGLGSFILAMSAVFFSYEYQMLFAAAALLVSYIIPGHLLQNEYRKKTRNAHDY